MWNTELSTLSHDVLLTVDLQYLKGADRRQSARHIAGPHVETDKKGYDYTVTGYVASRAMGQMALQIAWQMRVHVGSYGIDGGDGAR